MVEVDSQIGYRPGKGMGCAVVWLGILSLFTGFTGHAYAQGQAPLAAEAAVAAKPSIPEDGIDLAGAVAMSVIRHPGLARALAAQARGRADLAGAQAVWMPSVTYSANLGPNMFSSERDTGLNDNMQGPGIALHQLVWDFGRSEGEIGAASAIGRQRDFELAATADQIAETTALAYLDIAHADMQLREAERQLEEFERLRALIKLRSHAGISDQSDLMLADVRIEGARADVVQAETSRSSAKVALSNLTGIMPARYDNPAPILAQFRDDQADPDFDSLPIVASARENESAATARIGQAQAERYPRLGLQLGYNRNNYTYAEHDNALTAMVTVQGDLYRAGTSHKVTAAQQDRIAARAEKEAVILDIHGRIESARSAIQGGMARIDIYRLQEQKATSTRDIFIEEYKLGKRSLFDLLNAELEIYRAASARVASETDVMRARVQLHTAYGTLRTSLGLAAIVTRENHAQKTQ